jgi:hypothetical protein
MGTVRCDLGIYGGNHAGYWEDSSPLKISFFNNIANARNLKIVINVLGNINNGPTLKVESYLGTETIDLEAINANAGVYAGNYEAEGSTYLEVTASANNNSIKTRRSISLVVYKPSTGGILADRRGSKLIIPPNAIQQEVMITAEPELGAAMPEGVELSAPAGNRWRIYSPVDQWSDPGELVLPYDEYVIEPGTENGLAIWRYSEGEWERLESLVDPVTKTVHAPVFGSGTYSVIYEGGKDYSVYLPTRSELGQNYPNPFNPTTTIPFNLATPGVIDIRIYNLIGQEVSKAGMGWYTTGNHSVVWNGRNNLGQDVASGVYICRFKVHPAGGNGEIVHSRKIVLMR